MTLPHVLPADIVKRGAVKALAVVRGQGQDPLQGFGLRLEAEAGRMRISTGSGKDGLEGIEDEAAAEGNDDQEGSRMEGFAFW
jgi:hypothetical protein